MNLTPYGSIHFCSTESGKIMFILFCFSSAVGRPRVDVSKEAIVDLRKLNYSC